MLIETYKRNLRKIVCSHTNLSSGETSKLLSEIENLTNELKNDIAEAIKYSSQTSGAVDFIDVPQAISIVTQGGIPTKRERLELARECIDDGDSEEVKKLIDALLEMPDL